MGADGLSGRRNNLQPGRDAVRRPDLGPAFEFTRKPGETWKDAFSRVPRTLAMPVRVQGEAICYGRDGRSLYLTSERRPTPLWEVRPVTSDQ